MAKLDETLTMLKDLTDAKGIPGNEREVRQVMKSYIEPFADEVTTDRLGSLIAKNRCGKRPENYDCWTFGRSRLYGDTNH